MSCLIAMNHATRYNDCQCVHCDGECDCDDLEEALFDADELGLDPEDDDVRRYHA